MVLSTLTPSGRRAERFAALLDGDATADDAALASLEQLARSLTTLPLQRVAPDTEFRDALRQRLVAVATVRPAGSPATESTGLGARTARFGHRSFAIATGAVAAVVAIAGVGIAASRSLPGDPFYGVKRSVQAAQLFVTSGEVARGKEQLGFAANRLSEIAQLLNQPSALGPVVAGEPLAGGAQVPVGELRQALNDMDAETLAGTRDLTLAFADAHDRAALLALQSFATQQYDRLQALLPAFPAALQPRAEASLRLLAQIRARVAALLADGACTGKCAGRHTDRLGAVPAGSSSRRSGAAQPQHSTSGGTQAHAAPAPTSSSSSGSTSPSGTQLVPSAPTGSSNPLPAGNLSSLMGGVIGAPPTSAPGTAPTAPTSLSPSGPSLLPSSLPSLTPQPLPSSSLNLLPSSSLPLLP